MTAAGGWLVVLSYFSLNFTYHNIETETKTLNGTACRRSPKWEALFVGRHSAQQSSGEMGGKSSKATPKKTTAHADPAVLVARKVAPVATPTDGRALLRAAGLLRKDATAASAAAHVAAMACLDLAAEAHGSAAAAPSDVAEATLAMLLTMAPSGWLFLSVKAENIEGVEDSSEMYFLHASGKLLLNVEAGANGWFDAYSRSRGTACVMSDPGGNALPPASVKNIGESAGRVEWCFVRKHRDKFRPVPVGEPFPVDGITIEWAPAAKADPPAARPLDDAAAMVGVVTRRRDIEGTYPLQLFPHGAQRLKPSRGDAFDMFVVDELDVPETNDDDPEADGGASE